MKFLLGIVVGLVLAGVAGLAFVKSGRFDVAADKRAGRMERELAEMGMDAWVDRNAPKVTNPRGNNPEVLRQGLDHYKENCVVCHGVPGERPSEIARGMNPGPPDLSRPETEKMSDGQLFFIVSHGIRMTGMPSFAMTHKEDEIWSMVSFVRHLPQLTDAEKKVLTAGSDEAEHHHEQGALPAPGASPPNAPPAAPAPNAHGGVTGVTRG